MYFIPRLGVEIFQWVKVKQTMISLINLINRGAGLFLALEYGVHIPSIFEWFIGKGLKMRCKLCICRKKVKGNLGREEIRTGRVE